MFTEYRFLMDSICGIFLKTVYCYFQENSLKNIFSKAVINTQVFYGFIVLEDKSHGNFHCWVSFFLAKNF